ncbi:phage tail protein [Microbacterium sp. XT11]|uniref:phage tail protein n=1 Tax=Microbacterium sp. XT11 TaxID=367477 RepID=UPI000742E397|nr:tail fiber protein [Microbacterium sp. XT11]ALX65996.1 tail collar domain-containing protein [Microbacterium sp. XT11]
MAEPYIGEIRTVGFDFAPRGWARCDGQLLPISQNTALFSLLGTNYGGNGTTTFALPNLNGAFAIGQGDGPGLTPRRVGDFGGTTAVTLLRSEMPMHTHGVTGVAAAGTSGDPRGRSWAQSRYGRASRNGYTPGHDTMMAPGAVAAAGESAPHNNMPPFLGMCFVIALTGVFPPRE